jgi:hypothetical protein
MRSRDWSLGDPTTHDIVKRTDIATRRAFAFWYGLNGWKPPDNETPLWVGDTKDSLFLPYLLRAIGPGGHKGRPDPRNTHTIEFIGANTSAVQIQTQYCWTVPRNAGWVDIWGATSGSAGGGGQTAATGTAKGGGGGGSGGAALGIRVPASRLPRTLFIWVGNIAVGGAAGGNGQPANATIVTVSPESNAIEDTIFVCTNGAPNGGSAGVTAGGAAGGQAQGASFGDATWPVGSIVGYCDNSGIGAVGAAGGNGTSGTAGGNASGVGGIWPFSGGAGGGAATAANAATAGGNVTGGGAIVKTVTGGAGVAGGPGGPGIGGTIYRNPDYFLGGSGGGGCATAGTGGAGGNGAYCSGGGGGGAGVTGGAGGNSGPGILIITWG